ncbi:MAG: electron transport complex subunit RsxC [Arsenophonus sp. ET-LJ4-MAG3]
MVDRTLMNILLIIISIIVGFYFIFNSILEFIFLYFKIKKKLIIEEIDNILPQNQCGKCDYLDCRKYAEAIVNNNQTINKCIPGGKKVMLKIAKLFNIKPQVLDGNKLIRQEQKIAFIDEENCIGCTKCIHICPVDAIIGTRHAMHTVLKDLCIGCDLCVSICPTNSIIMLPIKTKIENLKWNSSIISSKNIITESNSILKVIFHNKKINNKIFNFLKKLILTEKKTYSSSKRIYQPQIKTQSNQFSILKLPLANELIIPIQQHIGLPGDIIVKIGDYVLTGQALTKGCNYRLPIHAATSGTITAIAPHITVHSLDKKELCIYLKPDNKDKWCERKPLSNYLQYSSEILLSCIEKAGIAELSGTGFSTAIKLKNGNKSINTLIINAEECEPYITADNRLIQEHANEIIEGILILIYILKSKEVFIAIEDNKQKAIIALKKALLDLGIKSIIKIKVIPTKYPLNEIKQLTKILTGKEIQNDIHSSFINILMQNVSTVFAIKRAIINGEPLIERVVTLTGSAIQNPGNYWVRLGTPVEFLLQQVGIIPQSKQNVIIGGPLMGITLSDLTAPIVKTSNCVFIPVLSEINKHRIDEDACIRCGHCAQVCPANLLPQQLYLFSRWHDHKNTEKYNLFDCIECGACVYVCPSNIPLVQYYQQEKDEIKIIAQEKKRISEAKKRFNAKKTRIKREKIIIQQHNQSAIKIEIKNKIMINKVLMRINAQKNKTKNNKIELFNNQAAIQIKKPKLYDVQLSKKIIENKSDLIIKKIIEQELTNQRKIIVASAIARVKAKRDAQNELSNNKKINELKNET